MDLLYLFIFLQQNFPLKITKTYFKQLFFISEVHDNIILHVFHYLKL